MTFFRLDTCAMCGYVVWRDNFHVMIWTRSLEITSVPITFLFVPEVITLFATHPFLQNVRRTSTRDVRGMSRKMSVDVPRGRPADVACTRNVQGRPRRRLGCKPAKKTAPCNPKSQVIAGGFLMVFWLKSLVFEQGTANGVADVASGVERTDVIESSAQ